jgi:hypothetical protein
MSPISNQHWDQSAEHTTPSPQTTMTGGFANPMLGASRLAIPSDKMPGTSINLQCKYSLSVPLTVDVLELAPEASQPDQQALIDPTTQFGDHVSRLSPCPPVDLELGHDIPISTQNPILSIDSRKRQRQPSPDEDGSERGIG